MMSERWGDNLSGCLKGRQAGRQEGRQVEKGSRRSSFLTQVIVCHVGLLLMKDATKDVID